MISHNPLHRTANVAKLAHYYNEQKDDYYARDSLASVWQGKGAKELGATGAVDVDRFHQMMLGNFGKNVKASNSIRKDSKSRAGIDLTISAPKSISIQAIVGGDERLIKAHDEAVAYTLDYIEKNFARARQTRNGKTYTEDTGNLVIAKFRHETARPTKDLPPDPNLHTHCVIMNITKRADGSWVTLSNEQIVGLKKLHDSVYNAKLNSLVQELGYSVRHEKDHIELAHISRKAINTFSKRSQQINADLASQGKTRETASYEQRQAATLKTRKGKTEEFTRAELHQKWVKEAKNVGVDFDAYKDKDKFKNMEQEHSEPRHNVADKAVNWAIKHLAERESVMPKSQLLEAAIKHAGGLASIEDIENALDRLIDKGELLRNSTHYKSTNDMLGEAKTKQSWASDVATLRNVSISEAMPAIDKAIRDGRLVAQEALYATKKALLAEKNIIFMERLGRDLLEPVMEKSELTEKLANTTLTKGQKEAIELCLTDKNQIVGIQGLAGTGKSYALQSTQKILKEKGFKMVALAPYGSQVSSLRADGIPAKTVASFLTATNKKRFTDEMDTNTVVVIDEAGVIPVRQMEKLLKHISKTGARIVTLGDTAQTKAVEAGRAFSLLQENGMKTALMGDIQRQKDEKLKQAVELAATGKASKSLELIDQVVCIADSFVENDGVKERDSSVRYEAIANSFVELSEEERAKTLIVTGTNISRNSINERIRDKLSLAGTGENYTLLTRHDTTRAERSYARYYTVGDVIQPERDYEIGLERGNLYKVVKVDDRANKILVTDLSDTSKEPIEITTKTMTKLSVYKAELAEISVGDKVRVTRNNAALDLVNGQQAEVIGISKDSIKISSKDKIIELPTNKPLHLDYAYVTTAHGAQGLTCDRVFYNAESFSKTTAQDTYYVSISRERHEVIVFTDDLTKLPKAVDRVSYKGLAHDILAKPTSEKDKHLEQQTQVKTPDLSV